MSFPRPEPGLVISYGYLWHSEHEQGREEGVKDRPCVIVLAVRTENSRQVVTVAPVTHSAPDKPEEAVEIPLKVKQHLGLDAARSWVVVTEVNDFVWPGPDMRPLPQDASRFDYGPLPPGLFRQIRDRLTAQGSAGRLQSVSRTE